MAKFGTLREILVFGRMYKYCSFDEEGVLVEDGGFHALYLSTVI